MDKTPFSHLLQRYLSRLRLRDLFPLVIEIPIPTYGLETNIPSPACGEIPFLLVAEGPSSFPSESLFSLGVERNSRVTKVRHLSAMK